MVGFGGCQGDVTVAALVSDSADLSQHSHGLLTRLRLDWVTCQVGVATVPSLKLLLLPSAPLTLVLDLVQGVVLVRERRR